MKVNEIFCSISGESINSGKRAVFVRSYGCNLACSYCDSRYSWQGDDYTEMTVNDVVNQVATYNCKYVVFTGGEPLLQEDAIELIATLLDKGYTVEVETNGAVSIEPVQKLNRPNIIVTMDWKCPSSKMNKKMLSSNLGLLTHRDVLKCVVGSQKDLEEMRKVSEMTDAQVFVSPVFGQIELREIAEYIINANINRVRVQVQLHKLCWPADMRGV